jgi:hypothetical protein
LKKSLVVILEGLGAKTNWLAVNRQAESKFDFGFDYPPGWGSVEFGTVRYRNESHETLTREWLHWRGPAVIVNDRPILSSEWAPHINKPATVWQ